MMGCDAAHRASLLAHQVELASVAFGSVSSRHHLPPHQPSPWTERRPSPCLATPSGTWGPRPTAEASTNRRRRRGCPGSCLATRARIRCPEPRNFDPSLRSARTFPGDRPAAQSSDRVIETIRFSSHRHQPDSEDCRYCVKIHTGDGNNTSTDRYWGSGNYIWNNAGDTATLKDAKGKKLDTCSYSDPGENNSQKKC